MGKRWRGIVGVAVLASALAGSQEASGRAVAAGTVALAFVEAGQVVVQESGVLTTVGSGQSPVWSPNSAHLLFAYPDYVGGTASISVADSHGSGARILVSKAYAWIAPSWSTDSQYIVYTAAPAGTPTAAASFKLEVRVMPVTSGASRLLGTVDFAAGCPSTGSALQSAAARAQGTYRGTPSTLIWVQPSTVVVQASCTGAGLTVFTLGGKPTLLKTWSAGVLSPDGKTVAAVVTPSGAKATAAQVGLLTLAGAKSAVLGPKLGAGSLVWSPDGKGLLALAAPANPLTGSVQVSSVSLATKKVISVGAVPGAGAYHPTVDATGKYLAFAVVANAAANAVVPPAVQTYFMATTAPSKATAFAPAGQPAWRQ